MCLLFFITALITKITLKSSHSGNDIYVVSNSLTYNIPHLMRNVVSYNMIL